MVSGSLLCVDAPVVTLWDEAKRRFGGTARSHGCSVVKNDDQVN